MCLTVRSGASPCLGRTGRGHQHLQSRRSETDHFGTQPDVIPKTKDPKGTTNEAGKFKTKMSYSLIWFKNIVVCLPRSVKMSWRSSSILILNMYPYVCLTPRLRKKVCYKCEKNAETSWIGKWTSSIKLKCDSLYVISSFPMFYTMFCGFKKRNETMWLIHKKSSKGNNLEI